MTLQESSPPPSKPSNSPYPGLYPSKLLRPVFLNPVLPRQTNTSLVYPSVFSHLVGILWLPYSLLFILSHSVSEPLQSLCFYVVGYLRALCNFSDFCVCSSCQHLNLSSYIAPQILLNTLFSKESNLFSICAVTVHTSYPYVSVGLTTAIYNLNFVLLENNLDLKNFNNA